MPTTPQYALRYPASTDPADVPSDLQKLASDVDTALGPKDPTGLVAGEAAVWNGSAWVRSSVTKLGNGSLAGYPWKNADIDPAAAIVYSKLALAGSIVNADIAAAAAIAIAKLAGYPADGSKLLAGDGTWKAVVGVPSGLIAPFAGPAAPSGWLLCDGSNVNRTTFAALFAAIGSAYGNGDGSTTFGLPDLRGRVPIGKNTGTFATLAATGGEETHLLILAETPSHTHTFVGNAMAGHAHGFAGNALPGHAHTFTGSALPNHSHHMTSRDEGAGDFKWEGMQSGTGGTNQLVKAINSIGGQTGTWGYVETAPMTQSPPTPAGSINSVSAGTPSGTVQSASAGTPSGTNSSAGSDGAHNNLPPYQVVNYIVKT